MKSIMLAIQPQWVEKILSGEKTIEVRKTAPKETPFKVYIYCTKGENTLYRTLNGSYSTFEYKVKGEIRAIYGDKEKTLEQLNGKVVAEFICDKVEALNYLDFFSETFRNKTCLSWESLFNYGKGKKLYNYHISDLKIYDKPKELREFKGYCDKKQECYSDVVRHCNNAHFDWKCNRLKRAPQSWQFVEELK